MRFGLPNVAEPTVDLSLLLAERAQLLCKLRTLTFGTIFVPLLILAENSADTGFERAAFLKSAAKQIDARGRNSSGTSLSRT